MKVHAGTFVTLLFFFFLPVGQDRGNTVRTGLDVLLAGCRDLLEGKRIGVIANQTSVTSDGEWILDALEAVEGLEIGALFVPEHGLDLLDSSTRDSLSAGTVVDLYGKSRSPDPAVLEELDLVVYDIQDLGCRFYTYISTMILAMDACAEAGVEFLVLDRPNPLGGLAVEGPLLEPAHASFVGVLPVPIRYGLTPGELAVLANESGYLPSRGRADLRVIPMEGWRRAMYYDDTGLPWTPTSPNMPDTKSALLYPGLCLLEGTNISEGRGTDIPFRLAGAPWLPAGALIDSLSGPPAPGISLAETTFTPLGLPGRAENPKYRGETIQGLSIRIDDRESLRTVRFACRLIYEAARMKPGGFSWVGNNYIDRLVGTGELREVVDRKGDLGELFQKWEREANEFRKRSTSYYLYED